MLLPLLILLTAAPLQEPLQSESFVYAPRDDAPLTVPTTQRTRIDGDQLRATGRRSLPEALAAAAGPGVWMQSTNLGGGSPFVRGLTGNQVLVLVDGVRLNDATTRFGPNQILNTIDPAIVESVEVTRGPASVLHGSDAIGGVVHVHTRRQQPVGDAAPERFAWALDSELNSSVAGGRLSPQLAWGGRADGLLFIGSAQRLDDLSTGDGIQEFTAYDSSAGFGAWTRDLDDGGRLGLSAWIHRDEDVPRTDKLVAGFGQTDPASERYLFSVQDRRQVLLAWHEDTPAGPFGFADSMDVRLSLRSYREDRERIQFGASTLRFERDETDSLGLATDWTRALGDEHLLTFGFDLDLDQVDSLRRDTDLVGGGVTVKDGQFAPNAEYLAFGAFVQDELLAFEPLDVTAGLRFSAYDFSYDGFGGGAGESGDFQALTASLQAARDVGPGQRVSATLAQGFRAPNLDDLAKDGDFGGGTELANPDLDPETSLTAELAYDYAADGRSFGMAVFGTEIRDVIGRSLTDAGGPAAGDETYLRANTGELRLAGIELAGEERLDRDGRWSFDYGLAWVRGRQYDDTLNVLTATAPFDGVDWRRVPPLHGQLGLTWAPDREYVAERGVGLESLRLGLALADSQEQLHPQDISDPRIDPNGTAGWARVDLDLHGPFDLRPGSDDHQPLGGRSSWSLGFHNLFDAAYRVHGSGFDAPGFTISLGLHWAP